MVGSVRTKRLGVPYLHLQLALVCMVCVSTLNRFEDPRSGYTAMRSVLRPGAPPWRGLRLRGGAAPGHTADMAAGDVCGDGEEESAEEDAGIRSSIGESESESEEGGAAGREPGGPGSVIDLEKGHFVAPSETKAGFGAGSSHKFLPEDANRTW